MATNYNTLKHEELFKLIEKYDLDKADYMVTPEKGGKETLNVKKLSNILKLIDIQAGKITETQAVDAGGNVGPHNPTQKLHKGLSGTMVLITFYSSDENDLPYVQMALNGIALICPREKDTWIPKEYIDGVLQNAVATRMKMDVDRDGKIRYIPKQVPRIQYHIKDIKHIDELKREFDERQAAKSNQ